MRDTANKRSLLGCKVEAHVPSGVRKTWAPHTASGYYVGNAWEHYRCHEVYISDTKSIQTCLTVYFKHKYLAMPSINPDDALISGRLSNGCHLGPCPKNNHHSKHSGSAYDNLQAISQGQQGHGHSSKGAQRAHPS
jgi:hypothetical protein